MRPWKLQVAVKSPLNLFIVRLILWRDDPMPDEEIQHEKSTVWLEFTCRKVLLTFFHGPEVELLDFAVVGFRDYVGWEFEIVDVLAWFDISA